MIELVVSEDGQDGQDVGLLKNHDDIDCFDDEYHAYLKEVSHNRVDDVDEPLGHVHYIERSSWLRAAVLGANDGLVSVSSLTIGMAAGVSNKYIIILTAVAALVSGALSMAVGEWVSVSAQKEIEMADVEKERQEQRKGPLARANELEELVQIYVERGLSLRLARQVAVQMCRKDLIRAHARDELGIDIDDYVDPFRAALASAVAFSCGAGVPILAVLLPVTGNALLISILFATTITLVANGLFGSLAGGAPPVRGTLRVVAGGWLAMLITFAVGKAFSTSVAV